MDLRSVNFEVHDAFERELRTFIAGEWGISGHAGFDGAGRSGAAASTYCRSCVLVYLWAARRRRCKIDIGKADSGVDIEAGHRSLNFPI